jgi:hypothetical protein
MGAFNRTPRPPSKLTVLSPIRATPARSRASITLKRDAGKFGELSLVDSKQGACGAHLACGNHDDSVHDEAQSIFADV